MNKRFKLNYHQISKAKMNINKNINKFLKNQKLNIVLNLNQGKYSWEKTNLKFNLHKIFLVRRIFHRKKIWSNKNNMDVVDQSNFKQWKESWLLLNMLHKNKNFWEWCENNKSMKRKSKWTSNLDFNNKMIITLRDKWTNYVRNTTKNLSNLDKKDQELPKPWKKDKREWWIKSNFRKMILILTDWLSIPF